MYLLAAGWMLYGMLILWTGLVPWELIPYFVIGGMAVFVLISTRIWRCPRCGAGFGRRWWVDVCPGCRLVLEVSTDAEPPGTPDGDEAR